MRTSGARHHLKIKRHKSTEDRCFAIPCGNVTSERISGRHTSQTEVEDLTEKHFNQRHNSTPLRSIRFRCDESRLHFVNVCRVEETQFDPWKDSRESLLLLRTNEWRLTKFDAQLLCVGVRQWSGALSVASNDQYRCFDLLHTAKRERFSWRSNVALAKISRRFMWEKGENVSWLMCRVCARLGLFTLVSRGREQCVWCWRPIVV